jgi:prepilin signal peptidase PulO-like enzyme (type II secretory pathway)
MEVFVGIWFFLLGLVLGSFYNVVIYRLPRNLSLIKPGSSCPKCGHRLGVSELVPVLSFLWQKGKCKMCGKKISVRYPLIELITGVGFTLMYWHSSSWGELLVGLVFFSISPGALPSPAPSEMGKSGRAHLPPWTLTALRTPFHGL